MAGGQNRGMWRGVYGWLSALPPGTWVSWAEWKDQTGYERTVGRNVLRRATDELEQVDGLTVGGQTKEGFEIRHFGEYVCIAEDNAAARGICRAADERDRERRAHGKV